MPSGAAPLENTDPPTPDETQLLVQLRAGDPAAFEKLVRAYGGRLLAVAHRFLHNEDEARDVLQDALLSAFKALDRFEGNARLSTWLHRIVVNTSLMRLRSRRRSLEEPIDELLPKFLEDGHQALPAESWRDSSEMMLEREQTCSLVRRCIERLPDSYRTVLLLRDIEELDTEEAARLLGVTPNAVKVRLHRARQALRSLLDPHLRRQPAGRMGTAP